MKQTRADILARIEDFLNKTHMSEREFGIRVFNDNKFIPRLRRGAGTTLTSIERAEEYMSLYPPTNKLSHSTKQNYPPDQSNLPEGQL